MIFFVVQFETNQIVTVAPLGGSVGRATYEPQAEYIHIGRTILFHCIPDQSGIRLRGEKMGHPNQPGDR